MRARGFGANSTAAALEKREYSESAGEYALSASGQTGVYACSSVFTNFRC